MGSEAGSGVAGAGLLLGDRSWGEAALGDTWEGLGTSMAEGRLLRLRTRIPPLIRRSFSSRLFRLASDLARPRRWKLKLANVDNVGRLHPPEERWRALPEPPGRSSWLLVVLTSASVSGGPAALALKLRSRGMRVRGRACDEGMPVFSVEEEEV